MKNQVIAAIKNALKKLNIESDIELTPSRGHGDFSTNVAMKIAKELNDTPVNVANKIISFLDNELIEKAEVAFPGFINLFLKENAICNQVEIILKQEKDFGKLFQNKYINVEYVSANPTGFLHIGHARGAAIGSSLVNILRFAGNKVDAEYYVNDAGNQINILGISSWIRYKNLFEFKIDLPNDSYKGSDIIECAKYLKDFVFGAKYKDSSYEEVSEIFKQESKKYLLEMIKKHLYLFGVEFNLFTSENDIYKNNQIEPALFKLKNYSYIDGGATWLKTTLKGDDKDRVMIKNDNSLTYFTPDIAYHNIKINRGYDELINIWGADHVGYIKRMEIAIEFLGLPQDKLDIFTIQLVKLMKENKEVKMSKRGGNTFTLIELIDEVGKDAARWFMIDRSSNSEFIFDMDLALSKTSDNPVFLVQYTHARANQLLNKSSLKPKPIKFDKQEIELINFLNNFTNIIEIIANTHKVNLLTQYLLELSHLFNKWYSNSKIIGNSREESMLSLVLATKIILKNGLSLLGISSPEKM